MRKEVKRSLLLWPAAASASIIAAAWLARPDDTSGPLLSPPALVCYDQPRGRLWHEAPPIATPIESTRVLHRRLRAPQMEIELVERAEHGSRAMKLPARLVDVFAVAQVDAAEIAEVDQSVDAFHVQAVGTRLMAPVRNEQHETAGLVLQPPKNTDASARESSPKLRSRQIPTASRTASSRAPRDRTIDGIPLESVADMFPVPVQSDLIGPPPLVGTPPFQGPPPLEGPPPMVGPPPLVGPHRPPFVATEAVEPDRVSMLPKSVETLGKLEPRAKAEDAETPQVSVATIQLKESEVPYRRDVNDSPAGWPVTQRLDEQLKLLAALAIKDAHSSTGQLVSSSSSQLPATSWAADVTARLSELRSLPRIGHPRAGELIDELSDLSKQGIEQAEGTSDRQQQIEWLCASHAIVRRVAVWLPVWQIASSAEPAWVDNDDSNLRTESLEVALAAVRQDLPETGDDQGWRRYLLLDELQDLLRSDPLEQRKIVAQRLLSRLKWHGLDPEHVHWLERDSIAQLAEAVRPWASTAVDYASLMNHIERQETDSIDLTAIEIANTIQSLRFAENPDVVRVADALDLYYRNANVRLAISESMLQRMLPTIDPQSVPVRTQLFGSKVRGVSQIRSDLALKLKPASDRWSMELQTIGNVHTQSTGFNGPVAVRTSGRSSFAAATPIEVTNRGVQVGDSDVDVRGGTKLRGIRSDYDQWPLIGSLVQIIAENRYDSLAPRSTRTANRLIRDQVSQEIDTNVDEKLNAATERLATMVLGPLGSLSLDPQVIDMQTTDDRLLARYRLAGDWQLGAFTPRPRAPQSSLMSLQVHQSALNNTLEQLLPRDEPKLIRDIFRDGLQMFGQSGGTLPDDIPDDVTVQFARTRPITVEIDDGQFWVTLRIMRLTSGDRLDLRRFIVRALYRPQVDGLQASLVREGHLRISGPGMSMRERLPARAIFNKVLSPNRPLQLTLPALVHHPAAENLAVSQLELRHGWIAIAISEADAPRIAMKRHDD